MYLLNGGTVQGSGGRDSYIGGLVGYFEFDVLNYGTNIGIVRSSNFDYAGGLVGYMNNLSGGSVTIVTGSMNAGIVEGATISVGGIAGYLARNAKISHCINTNRIFTGAASNFGAIVGENYGSVDTCVFDEQMSVIGDAFATGYATQNTLGNSLAGVVFAPFVFADNMYPRPVHGSYYEYHPIAMLAAAPIRLATNAQNVNNVTTDFWVSNWYSYR